MKVLITNTVALNAGDAAILQGIIKSLKSVFGDAVDITVYDSQEHIVKKYYPEINFKKLLYFQTNSFLGIRRPVRIFRWLHRMRLKIAIYLWVRQYKSITNIFLKKSEQETIKDYSKADLIISTGGTYLVDNYFLTPRILDYELSLSLKRSLVFFTQSLGPFENSQNRKSLASVFGQSKLILLRDKRSLTHLKDLNIENSNVYVTSDAAFTLANTDQLSKAIENLSHITRPSVAISVRDWQYFKKIDVETGKRQYIEAIKNLSAHLVREHNSEITFISTCQGISEYHLDDSEIALNIFNQLPEDVQPSVCVNQEFHNPESLSIYIQKFDFVIATRLHMAILSLGSGVPVFPISYEFKTQELFKRLNQQAWIIDIEEIESKMLIEKVNDFMKSIPKFRRELFLGVLKEHNEALKSAKLLKKV